MTSMNSKTFQMIANSFMAGDTFSVANHFCYPTAVYLRDDTLVYQSRDELGGALATYHDHLKKFGYRTTTVKVNALSLTRGTTQSVWVNWQHLTADGTLIEESCIRYLGSLKSCRGFQIQLSEYLVAPSVCARSRDLFAA